MLQLTIVHVNPSDVQVSNFLERAVEHLRRGKDVVPSGSEILMFTGDEAMRLTRGDKTDAIIVLAIAVGASLVCWFLMR
jgi:hypothetical protein